MSQGSGPVLVAGHWRFNAEMIADALRVHLPPPAYILDATWGEGNFWNEETMGKYLVDANKNQWDFRQFPFKWHGKYDAVMFDPPYVVRGGRSTDSTFRTMNEAYGLVKAPKTVAELSEMNRAGLKECVRVVRYGGLIFVKYMDAVSSGRRQHQIDDINDYARFELGLEKVDRFIFYTKGARPQPKRTRIDGKPSTQKHAHNNTSELIIYRKKQK